MILVSGANGFIGNALVKALLNSSCCVVATSRSIPKSSLNEFDRHAQNLHWREVSEIGPFTDWSRALSGVEVVIHCAGMAHRTKGKGGSGLEKFRQINVAGTVNFAKQAALHGVKRFIFLSSIAVNGQPSRSPINESSPINPSNSYAVSKLEAEIALVELSLRTGMEYVIIRPPMVYGPGAPGNFGKLVTTVLRGVPLPLGAVYNRRSLIALDNLLSFILICSDSARFPNAANQIFVVSDCEDVSTTEFVKKIAKAARRSVRLVPVPVFILKFLLSTVGMKAINDSLFGDLQIDATKARCCLKWRPVTSMDNQLAKVFEKI